MPPTITTLPLERILRDDAVQQRADFNAEKMYEYRDLYAEGRDLGALVAFHDGESASYILADGFHRWAAAHLAGLNELPVEVLGGTKRDAILYATSHNLHGAPLTNKDKRRRVLTMLRDPEWAAWSNNSIAKHCGLSHTFVNDLRRELSRAS